MSNLNQKLITEINNTTKEITDLTNLGLYLAQYQNEKALKILYWLVIAIQNEWIEKEMNFNKPKKIRNNLHATIASRLIENPLYISKEIFDYIAKTNKIDFNFRPYKTYSIKEIMTKITIDTHNQESKFYNQHNTAKKTLETLAYFTKNSTMNINKTMTSFLLKALHAEKTPKEIKEIILQILCNQRTPHINYDDKIKENLEMQKNILLQEKQNRILTTSDYELFQKIIQPKLEKKVIKLKK